MDIPGQTLPPLLPDAPAPGGVPVPAQAPLVPTLDGGAVWLFNEKGQPFRAKQVDVPALLSTGFSPVPEAEAQKFNLQDKHDSAIESLKAFGQGAAETLAPVVAPLVMAGAGRSMQEQREAAEYHPVAHTSGQVVGAIAPAVATMGASAPASAAGAARVGLGAAARVSAPEMINVAGRAAGAAVEGVAGKTALSRITASAVNQATQAAAYTGADWANRVVQGDPKATAEQLFSQGAGAVLFGGGLGALGGAMTKMAGSYSDDLVGALREAEARGGIKATGAIQGIISKWEKQVGPERLKEIGRFLGREGGVGPFKSFEEMLALSESRFKEPAVAKMEEILQSVTGQKGGYGTIDDIINEIRKDKLIQKWGRNPFTKGEHDRFQAQLDDLENRYVLSRDVDGNPLSWATVSPKNLHELSQFAANEARGFAGSGDPHKAAITEAFDSVRFNINRHMDEMFDNVTKNMKGQPQELSKAWKEAKFRYQAGLFLEDGATKGWNRGWGNNRISPTEFLGTMAGAAAGHAPGAAIFGTAVAVARREGSALENMGARNVADFLEKIQQRSGQKIMDGVGKIFGAAGGKMSAEFSEAWNEHQITRENFAAQASSINRMSKDPEHAAQKITGAFGPLVEGHGQVALAFHDTASRVAQSLSAALPAYQKAGPLDRDYVPSPTELGKFNRQWLVAHEPTSVLHRIADGTYLAEDGKALATMYPSLAPKIKAAVADALAEKLASGEMIPARSRLGLSQFLGMDLDRRTTGGAIAAAQAVYLAQANTQANQKPAPKVDFKSSSQGMTDRQATQARMEKA